MRFKTFPSQAKSIVTKIIVAMRLYRVISFFFCTGFLSSFCRLVSSCASTSFALSDTLVCSACPAIFLPIDNSLYTKMEYYAQKKAARGIFSYSCFSSHLERICSVSAKPSTRSITSSRFFKSTRFVTKLVPSVFLQTELRNRRFLAASI